MLMALNEHGERTVDIMTDSVNVCKCIYVCVHVCIYI